MFKFSNKRASIGAAMTWVVATFIIFFLVILFIYSSYTMAKEKEIKELDIFVLDSGKSVGMDVEQTLLALLKTKIGQRSVGNYISQGRYEEVKSFVKSTLNELPELKGSSVVYVGNKKVELKDNSLEVVNV